ncbi:MAG: YfhO family protein, partial [Ignavibacteriae bacterium]|nr:YfhO family protein [Ignavibacteriota bacterium]
IQVRTGHYQIIFYTAIMIFSVGVYPILKLLLDGKTVEFGKTIGLLVLSLVLSLGMAAQPLLLNKEYLPYSKRGKTTIDLKNKNVAKTTSQSDGVSMEYATNWSTHPLELMRIILPHAYGGIHGEKYTGKEHPQLRNQKLSLYWGFMPFHTMIDYVGVLTILLAFLALFVLRKNNFVFSLGLFALFLIVLSFGKHFESFYALFYNYFPFFNKFRAPTMSITVTSFVFVILAAYGLNYIQNIKSVTKNITNHKNMFYVIGGFLFVGVLIWLMSGGFEYMKANENYFRQFRNKSDATRYLEMLKSIRQTLFTNDIYRFGFFVITFGAMIAGYVSKKINFTQFAGIVIVIVAADLITVSNYYGEDYSPKTKLNDTAFRKNKIDNYLEQDKSLHRIMPVGNLMGDNRWGYNSQTIGGYSAIKMYTIEELVQNCYYGSADKNFPINWNILQFLNVKYLVLQQQIQHPKLTPVSADQNAKLFLYKNNDFNKRAFFVGETELIKDEYARLERINSQGFDANKTALIEEELSVKISAPDSSSVNVVDYNINKLSLDVYTNKTSLLVISELFYPPGWEIYIDGNEVEKIYKTDHAVQSIVVTEGNHKVEVVCHPDSYFFYKNISWASVGIIYLIIGLGIFFSVRKKQLGVLTGNPTLRKNV